MIGSLSDASGALDREASRFASVVQLRCRSGFSFCLEVALSQEGVRSWYSPRDARQYTLAPPARRLEGRRTDYFGAAPLAQKGGVAGTSKYYRPLPDLQIRYATTQLRAARSKRAIFYCHRELRSIVSVSAAKYLCVSKQDPPTRDESALFRQAVSWSFYSMSH